MAKGALIPVPTGRLLHDQPNNSTPAGGLLPKHKQWPLSSPPYNLKGFV